MKAIRQCALWVALVVAVPHTVQACATCFGKSDSDLARAMNWGIASLLVVVVVVLGGIAAFFIYLARRAAILRCPSERTDLSVTAVAETADRETLPETSELIER